MKKSVMKRVFAMLLVLMVGMTSLYGCGKKADEKEKEKETSVFDSGIDLEGYEFVIAEGYYYDAGDMPVMEYGQSDYIDAVLDRNALIEETFNCTITYEYYTPSTFYSTVYPSILAGDKVADVMTPSLFAFGQFVNSDALYDISTLPHVNLDADYYIDAYDSVATIGDATYGISANFAHPYKRAFSVFFNKQIVEDLGLEDPYKLVEEGKWTWAKFEEYCKKAIADLNMDGKYDANDRFAAGGADMDALIAFYMSSGNSIFTEEDGNIKYNLNNRDSIDKINQMNDLFTVPGCFFNQNLDFEQSYKKFTSGGMLFFINGAMSSNVLSEMDDDFGILPMPKYDEESDYYCGADHNSPIVCVPSSIDNPEATGLILEALSYESEDELKVWLEEVSNAYYRDDESVTMLKDYIIPNFTVDSALLYHTTTEELGVGVDAVIGNKILRDLNSDPATLIEAYKTVVQTQLDEICN